MSRCTCHDTLIVKNLNRWFKEKWVDVSRRGKDGKHPPCGRSKAKTSSKGYPKCRPSVKVSSKTPKTSGQMTSGEKRAATKRKRSKKQGVGGKPTIVKFDSEKSRDAELLEYMFDHDQMPPLSEMNERQRGVAQAALNLPSSYLAEEGWDGSQYNHLFSEGHEQIPDHEYARLQQALYQYAHEIEMHMNSPHTDKSPDFLDESNSDHPEHPWKIARDLAGKTMEEALSVYPESFSDTMTGEPMDIAWRLLKSPVSPEAKRHKIEYDKKYESTPERVKYREELNRERRKRGIYGQGGPDMSHTKDHTIVAESPHANRARHFKERGTLKSETTMSRSVVLVRKGN
jgi:hypothetical protein